MAVERICPHCSKTLPISVLGGICPECMLKTGLLQTEVGDASAVGSKPPKPEEIAPLFPQLELIECLGRGGMGAVYKARQPKLNRLVALKILARERENDPKFTERFTREAQALARLSHPKIVAVYDFGEAAGLCYLLMEFVDGMSLRQLMQGGKLSASQALSIVPSICEALQFAHEQGVVHRDIKPENILLDKQGRVKIADFGIAKMVGGESERSNLTEERQVVGTPHYMAPEQVEKPQEVDHRADIYSLGVVFYEMLTGELPLGRFLPPSRKAQVDVRLDEVVLHALEKEPERRYQRAGEVKTDVESIATSRLHAVPGNRPADSRKEGGKLHSAAVISFVAAALLCGIWVLVHATNQEERSGKSVSAGITGWWKAESNALDSVGGNNATLMNGAGFGAGEVNTAFSLDGRLSYVMVESANSNLNIGAGPGMTIEGWINAVTVDQEQLLCEWERVPGTFSGDDVGVNFAIQASTRLYVNLKDTGGKDHLFFAPPNLIGTNIWQHVAMTYDTNSGMGALYVNGAAVAAQDFGSFTPQTSFASFLIGARTTFGSVSKPISVFGGGMDEWTVYNRALSRSEIRTIYDANKAGKHPIPRKRAENL